MNQSRKAVRAMVEGAIFVALAEILGYLKLWHMPEGGSISLMMLPIIIFALRWGVGQGLLAGLALGILDFMLSGGIAIGWRLCDRPHPAGPGRGGPQKGSARHSAGLHPGQPGPLCLHLDHRRHPLGRVYVRHLWPAHGQ